MIRFYVMHLIDDKASYSEFNTARECLYICDMFIKRYNRCITKRCILDTLTGELMSKRYFLKNYDEILAYDEESEDEIVGYFYN